MAVINIQDLPVEILEQISDFLTWVERARCQLTCKALYRNMRNDKKDANEAYEFYYKQIHLNNYPFNYCPYVWSSNFRVVTMYSLLLTELSIDKYGLPSYPCVLVTIVLPRTNKTKVQIMRKHLDSCIKKAYQNVKPGSIVTRVMGNRDTTVLDANEEYGKDVEMLMYKEYISVRFIKILRWFLCANKCG